MTRAFEWWAMRLVLTAVLALLLLAPAATAKPKIVAVCGDELCRIDPATGNKQTLTRNGKKGGPVYRTPSLSRNGKRLAFTFGNDLYVARSNAKARKRLEPTVAIARIRPDGQEVAYLKSISTIIDPGLFPCCRPPTFGLIPFLFRIPAGGGDSDTVARSIVSTGWLGAQLLRQERPGGDLPDRVCVLASNEDFECERPVAEDASRDVTQPDGSPNGKTVVAVAEPHSSESGATLEFSGSISLFDASTGALVRNLTRGPADSGPAFSPDGKRVAFTRKRSIWVVPAKGGKAKKLAAGTNPTWGG